MTPTKMSKRSAMSVLLSNAMDMMGYNTEMIRCRQETYRTLDRISNINNKDGPCTRFTTGGKAEGIARYFESDIDHLHIVKNVICTDEPCLFEDSNHLTLFKVDNADTSPGYVKLKLLKHNGGCLQEEISDSLFEDSYGMKYISSIKFTENIKESTIWLPGFTTQAKSGPSSPVSNGYLSIDRVVSLSCILQNESKNLLNRWERRRNINDTSRGAGLKVHAVPVGNNLSANKYLEWRLSYTEAEINLVQNLSLTHLKVYILLKLIARTIFKPICNEMTSYLMKNVILWTSLRRNLHNLDRITNILDILHCCLDFLRKCLMANFLPSFMLPNRNLLRGRVGFHENKKIMSILTNMLSSGPSMIFCCAKVRIAIHALIKIPQFFKAYSVYRNEIEKMILVLCTCRARLRIPGVTQDQYDRMLIQDRVYRTTKLKILAQIGLFDPTGHNDPEDVEEILKSTKGEYYKRLSRMLS